MAELHRLHPLGTVICSLPPSTSTSAPGKGCIQLFKYGVRIRVFIHGWLRHCQVATDALVAMERAMARDDIVVNDRQLACARIHSEEGQNYLKAMACAANYAWVNRSSMTFLARQAFAKLFKRTPDQLDMHVIYDVSHNIAKVPPDDSGHSSQIAFRLLTPQQFKTTGLYVLVESPQCLSSCPDHSKVNGVIHPLG